jgi:hypothetical protein
MLTAFSGMPANKMPFFRYFVLYAIRKALTAAAKCAVDRQLNTIPVTFQAAALLPALAHPSYLLK